MVFGKKAKLISKESEEELEVESEEEIKQGIEDLKNAYEEELSKLKSTNTKKVKEVKKVGKVEEVEEVTEVEGELENRKAPKLDEILINHEQRITQMEAKWFRLGGI